MARGTASLDIDRSKFNRQKGKIVHLLDIRKEGKLSFIKLKNGIVRNDKGRYVPASLDIEISE